jgi:hypothetical protein
MDMQTIILIILGILVMVWLFSRNRGRVQPPGTYDDPNYRSSGNIGGQQPTYDDPDFRSGGSIGGQQRTNDYDIPDRSGSNRLGGPLNNPNTYQSQPRTQSGPERPRHDSKDFKSGGSIGGKSK